jgi:hypothetical protein
VLIFIYVLLQLIHLKINALGVETNPYLYVHEYHAYSFLLQIFINVYHMLGTVPGTRENTHAHCLWSSGGNRK